MDCEGARARMSAACDGALEKSEKQAFDSHLASCAACQAELDEMRVLGRTLAAVGVRRAPAGLRVRVQQSLRAEAGPQGLHLQGQRSKALNLHGDRGRLLAVAASVAFAIVLSVLAGYQLGLRESSHSLVRRDAVAAHIRSLLQDAPIQVASSDSHTVKPWFAGRVDASPVVRDLSTEGYALLGGRVDYVGGRRVGVLVYKQRQHLITIYFWPSAGADEAAVAARQNGYNLLQWTASGLDYLAVSDLNLGDMQRLSRLL